MDYSVENNADQCVMIELPWFFKNIPTVLEEFCGLMDRRWLFEFMANTYLHFRNDNYCGMRFHDVVYNTLLETAVDQTEDPTSEHYALTINAVQQVWTFVKEYERPILAYFDRLGVPSDMCDYASVTCPKYFNVAQWNFFRPLF